MTIKIWTDGETLLDADINNNFDANKFNLVYTAGGLDSSVSGASQSTANSVELTAITPGGLGGSADYLIVELNGFASAKGDNGNSSSVTFKIETKDVGGSYSDSLATATLQTANFGTSGAGALAGGRRSYRHFHLLTANEKSAGVQVQITVTSATGNDSSNSASYSGDSVVLSTASV